MRTTEGGRKCIANSHIKLQVSSWSAIRCVQMTIHWQYDRKAGFRSRSLWRCYTAGRSLLSARYSALASASARSMFCSHWVAVCDCFIFEYSMPTVCGFTCGSTISQTISTTRCWCLERNVVALEGRTEPLKDFLAVLPIDLRLETLYQTANQRRNTKMTSTISNLICQYC